MLVDLLLTENALIFIFQWFQFRSNLELNEIFSSDTSIKGALDIFLIESPKEKNFVDLITFDEVSLYRTATKIPQDFYNWV